MKTRLEITVLSIYRKVGAIFCGNSILRVHLQIFHESILQQIVHNASSYPVFRSSWIKLSQNIRFSALLNRRHSAEIDW